MAENVSFLKFSGVNFMNEKEERTERRNIQ